MWKTKCISFYEQLCWKSGGGQVASSRMHVPVLATLCSVRGCNSRCVKFVALAGHVTPRASRRVVHGAAGGGGGSGGCGGWWRRGGEHVGHWRRRGRQQRHLRHVHKGTLASMKRE